MPRTYKRKTNRGSGGRWDEESLGKAIASIENGQMTILTSSKTYDIPRSTLILKLKGWKGKIPRKCTRDINNGGGRSTQLNLETEGKIAKYIEVLSKWGFEITKSDVLEIVQNYVNENNIKTTFQNGKPGDDWFLNFKKRWRLTLRKPELLQGSRARQANDPFITMDFYDKQENIIRENNLENKPECIYNCDETGFNHDPLKTKIVTGIGESSVVRVTGGSGREYTTVLACASAAAVIMPPMILHKGKRLWTSMFGNTVYPGTSYFVSEKGWMTEDVFKSWFKKCFLNHVKNYPALLIYDGHLSHISLDIIEAAIAARVIILKLPPHASHILQPLDVSVFKGVKSNWDKILTDWARSNPGKRITKSEFADLINEVWQNITPAKIKSGFKKTGIFDSDLINGPVNRQEIHISNNDPEKFSRYLSYIEDLKQSHTSVSENTQVSDLCANEENSSVLASSSVFETPTKKETPSKSFEKLLLSKISDRKSAALKKVRRRIDVAKVMTQDEFIERIKRKEDKPMKEKRLPRKINKKKQTYDSTSESENMSHSDNDGSDYEPPSNEKPCPLKEKDKIDVGSFVLVEFKGGKRGCTNYYYVSIIQELPQEDEDEQEYTIMSLRCLDSSKKCFALLENDISFVQADQIKAILPNPDLDIVGERIRYVFNGPVEEVFEK